jgi:amino acid permease
MGADEEKKAYGSDVEAASPNGTIEDIEVGEGGLKRNLKGRHMQMIAIGGSIGAGLFVGSGSALTSGGPGSLVIDFIIIGFMLLLTVNALGELAGKSAIRNPKISVPDFTKLYTLSLVLSITTLSVSLMRVGDLPWVGTTP